MKLADFPGRLSGKSASTSASSLAVNFRRFKFFGLLPGAVVLAGPVTPSDGDASSSSSTQNAAENRVRASFDSPRVSLGGSKVGLPVLRLGPTSEVQLDTTYLGPRLRISRGATSGTPFVFKHLTEPTAALDGTTVDDSWSKAEMWRPLLRSNADLSGKPVGIACAVSSTVAWVAASGVNLARGQGLWPGGALSFVALGLAAFGFALATSTGGIDERERQ